MPLWHIPLVLVLVVTVMMNPAKRQMLATTLSGVCAPFCSSCSGACAGTAVLTIKRGLA